MSSLDPPEAASSRQGSERVASPRPAPLEAPRPVTGPQRQRRRFVLCFDGTGNKFCGNDADSNILKIYRMLDRSDGSQFHYYQPGIGTYVNTNSLSHKTGFARFKSWYAKAKDSAIGTSFAEHVMGGYKFLMRYYSPGDHIYFFGFSRGAYTARFLAEMLDHVGLLSAGNEEMAFFAWKTFQKWQIRQERTAEEKAQKKELLEFMCAFRETFSRPVHRIRFLGLFDTVNSVPRFENAWMQRSKFPYTARSSAKVIRHAVAIDERRAKFRQDLISEVKQAREHRQHRHRHHFHYQHTEEKKEDAHVVEERKNVRARGRSESKRYQPRKASLMPPPETFRDRSEVAGIRSRSPGLSAGRSLNTDGRSVTPVSQTSLPPPRLEDDDSDGEQDIQEVWFAGCHADIGGGWPLEAGEDSALSHVPLVWMVHEAQRAGLEFDEVKMRALNCCADEETDRSRGRATAPAIPTIEVEPASRSQSDALPGRAGEPACDPEKAPARDNAGQDLSPFHRTVYSAATRGKIHDVLQFNNGLSAASVISWNIMEYLPFRRMDLQADGSWKSITWPLPKGEVRDVPKDVVVHGSVLRRMEADPSYRPGNLICGGGGRGVRKAPEGLGMGEWQILRNEGDPVGEMVVRASSAVKKGEMNGMRSTRH
ncbi:hypothetical protein H2199_002811 [Coniosporium tulheliwenetii]|uniref:Uncharacterized protein n=1 Tax=Coniosporium tulheliwenetii TaxID=3383036 RepID=A0ACC2ZEG8_9PEZI|nr:hypothetical protein H2199_002811 [Cladosporium sp. JES 115]